MGIIQFYVAVNHSDINMCKHTNHIKDNSKFTNNVNWEYSEGYIGRDSDRRQMR